MSLNHVFCRRGVVFLFSALVFVCLVAESHASSSDPVYPPIVMMHGVMHNKEMLSELESLIRERVGPKRTIFRAEIKPNSGSIKAIVDSVLLDIHTQIDYFADTMKQFVKDGHDVIDCIAHSQGTLIVRGYIQRYSHYAEYPRCRHFFSFAGPHSGVYAVPGVSSEPGIIGDIAQDLLDMIDERLAHHLSLEPFSFFKYLVNPHLSHELRWAQASTIADLNQIHTVNPVYKDNILALKSFHLFQAGLESVVLPACSSDFGDWVPDEVITDPDAYPVDPKEALKSLPTCKPLEESILYQEDRLGLRTLDEQGKLFRSVQEDFIHGDYRNAKVIPILDSTVVPLLMEPL